MTPDQMRERSSAKVKQVMELMEALQIKVEARERVNEQGFIEKLVYWIDEEKYSEPTKEVPVAETDHA